MFYVYLLQSLESKTYYIGQAKNLSERLERHNAGFVQSTKAKRPWTLIGFEEYSTREESRWREYNLKKNYSEKKKFIKKLSAHSSTDRTPPSEGGD